MSDYDLIGSIAIIKGEGKTRKEKFSQAKKLLERPNVRTVLEKSSNVKGRLRTIKTKYVAGEKNTITMHKENNCRFKFDVETCYFSPRLSNERKVIAEKVRAKDRVLVMFAGVGAYPIVIYKIAKPREIVGIEIGKECCRYFKENLKLNKISEGKIKIVQGDVKRKINKELGKFDVVVMARPNLKDSFLKEGLMGSKKNTKLFYYGFCKDDEIDRLVKSLVAEAKGMGRRLKLTEAARAGDIAPYKYRYRIEFKVLS
jgi:tRNA (guanine37-N1)-methyltransferase